MAGTRPLSHYVWHDLAPRAGWQQMALDHALLDRATQDGTIVLRLYRWDGDTVSFGANERALRSWDRNAFERRRQPVVRRPTGGRAVWHGADDLTYAVTAPLAALGGLRPAYRTIHERLARAFGRLGHTADLAPQAAHHPGLDAGACFDMAVGGEVVIGGRKTVGSAQLAAGPSLLQHGAIALADRAARLARFGQGSAANNTALPAAAPPLTTPRELAEAIGAEWQDAGAMPAPAALIAWAQSASAVHAGHYQDADWTWRR